ncbi:hypothetical protein J6590_027722 [Homalodisca vitripennis]|nr:hypothetical protein J6590_027722 [Homalodisca vitripennis]
MTIPKHGGATESSRHTEPHPRNAPSYPYVQARTLAGPLARAPRSRSRQLQIGVWTYLGTRNLVSQDTSGATDHIQYVLNGPGNGFN